LSQKKLNRMINPQIYEIYSDGGSRGNPGPGASAFIVYKNKELLYQKGFFLPHTTNNIAEYFAVLMAVTWLSKNFSKAEKLKILYSLDSELVVKQLQGVYKIKNEKLKIIFVKIKKIILDSKFGITFQHIPREKNKAPDAIVNKVLDENL